MFMWKYEAKYLPTEKCYGSIQVYIAIKSFRAGCFIDFFQPPLKRLANSESCADE